MQVVLRVPEFARILLRIPEEALATTSEMHCILHLAAIARHWAHDHSSQLSLVPLLESVGKLHVEYMLRTTGDKVEGDQHCSFALLDIILGCAEKTLKSLLDSQV